MPNIKPYYKIIQLIIVSTIPFIISLNAYGLDSVKVPTRQSKFDKRVLHKHEVIKRALQISEPKYGPFNFEIINLSMSRKRALRELNTGEVINAYIALANNHWNEEAIPVKIPIRMGLLSYRLLLTNKNNSANFENINSESQLKKLSVGLQSDWVIHDTFLKLGHNVVSTSNFDGTFLMLQRQRFDYIPRGIYEIYDELDARGNSLKDVQIDPSLAVYLRVASFIYVSKKHPKLAERLEYGLNLLVESGEHKKILEKYYGDTIAKANLSNRKIIYLNNPDFHYPELEAKSELWFTPDMQ